MGFVEELFFLKSIFLKIFNYRGKNFFIRGLRKFISLAVSPFASHSILMIFKKIN